jgi:hypothetical protein
MSNNHSDVRKKVIQQVTDAMEYYMKSIDENNNYKEQDGVSRDFNFSLQKNIVAREDKPPWLFISSIDLDSDIIFRIDSNGNYVTFLNLEEFTTLARSMVEFLTKNGINYGKE